LARGAVGDAILIRGPGGGESGFTMPLDAGEVPGREAAAGASDRIAGLALAGLRPVKVVLATDMHVGLALRAARESLGLGPDDIAQVTRVRSAYITAIEAFDFGALPARPFIIGYVRAYAQALGVNAEAVVARFHAEAPPVDGKLRAPGGVRHDALGGVRWLLISGAAVAGAVMVWNVSRRVELRVAAPARASARLTAGPQPDPGPTRIGAPLPTPPEATTPPVYVTPGLAPPDPARSASDAAGRAGAKNGAKTGSRGPTDAAPGEVGPPFAAAGAVFGAPAQGGDVVLQARKATSLVVRGAGGAVLFARLLAPGEAWRAPASLAGLTADVGEASGVEVFVGGTSRGRLTQAQTALTRLEEPDAGPAR